LSRSIYHNRLLYIEYLDQRLRIYKKSNILEENLFILLSSLLVVALLQVHSIIHLALVILVWWLTTNSYILDKFNWLVYSMGYIIDTNKEKATILTKSLSLIIDELLSEVFTILTAMGKVI